MKLKTMLNVSGALVTLGGGTIGSYYALNYKSNQNTSNNLKKEENPPAKQEIPNKGKRSIRESLQGRGLVLLNTKTDADKQTWENLVLKYLNGALRNEQKIGALIQTTTDKAKDDIANVANLKEACDKLFESKEDKDAEFSKNESLAENWCTKQSQLLQS